MVNLPRFPTSVGVAQSDTDAVLIDYEQMTPSHQQLCIWRKISEAFAQREGFAIIFMELRA